MAFLSAAADMREQFHSSSDSSLGRGTERIVCAPEDCWVTFLYVRPNDQVVCGEELCEIVKLGDDGAEEPGFITAPDYGVVKSIEGTNLFSETNARESLTFFVEKGTPLFLITRERLRREAGTIRGLTPRPTRVMRLRYMRMMRMFQLQMEKRLKM